MRKQKVPKKMKWAFSENCIKERFTVLVEDNIDWLEETLSGELRSRECYTNNLFPAIKWIKPFCMVNWRLLLVFLFIYLFIYFQVTALLTKSNRSYFNQETPEILQYTMKMMITLLQNIKNIPPHLWGKNAGKELVFFDFSIASNLMARKAADNWDLNT